MDATELRYGNLLALTELARKDLFDTAEVILKENTGIVTCIEQFDLRLYVGGMDCEFNYSDVEPIPLTEEWLLKLGWGKGEFDTEYIDNVSLSQEVLIYTVNSNMLCIETNGDIIEINHIKYVHQLQNLIFALTGKELKQ